VPAEGYLRRVLADGALPFRYRGGVRALLGEPDGPGLLRATPPAPQPQFSYRQPAWTGEIELPDGLLTMATGRLDRPTGADRPGRGGPRGLAAGGISHGAPDEIPRPVTGQPSAAALGAAAAERGPRPGTAASPGAVMDVSPAAGPVPAPARSAGPARAAQSALTEPARQMAAELTQAPVTRPDHAPGPPQAGPPPPASPLADAGPGPARSATALARRGPEPTAPAGGPRELLIPGKTVRPSLVTGSEQAGAGPDASGGASQVSSRQPGGPLRRSGGEPTGITGREPAMTDSSGDRGTPDPGLTVRRIPPHPTGAAAREHDGGPVIPSGQAVPLHAWRPARPSRQDDIVPAGQADVPPPRPAARQPGLWSRAEQPSAEPPAAPPAPQIIVMSPPRTPTSPPAFWERCRLGRLWSRPLR
jgi:hypothetical protein